VWDPRPVVSISCVLSWFGCRAPYGKLFRSERYDDEILRIRLSGWWRTKKVGDGCEPRVSPAGTLVAYRNEGGVWLADYASGSRRLLTPAGEGGTSFAPEVEWLPRVTGERSLKLADVTEPAAAAAAEPPPKTEAPWRLRDLQWAGDRALYGVLARGTEEQWIRFAAPAWKLEELGPTLTEGQRTSLASAAARRERDPLRSPDSSMLLKERSRSYELPDLLFNPRGDVHAENLDVLLPDGQVRKLTSFGSLW